ncbi:MAG: tRNA epoxyqueuosine(34) reductase QueG [Muribaculaceae bacterium]
MATNLKKYQCTPEAAIKQRASELGFDACGFAKAEAVDDEAQQRYGEWIANGKNYAMPYAERYGDVRSNPVNLLPGAKTVISLAMNYFPAEKQDADALQIAYYAYGRDYHEVVRERLTQLALFIAENWEAECRVCVDTAPIREKYWAQRAGVGFVGRNNLLIIPGKGSYFFLGEVVTTLELQPDEPCTKSCGNCRRCVDACPGGALSTDGSALDAGKCLSCLLIEYRGEQLPDWAREAKGNRLYGCDQCQKVCPHNALAKPTKIADFAPRHDILSLTSADVEALTQDEFSRLFAHSAIKRVKLSGLKRNL